MSTPNKGTAPTPDTLPRIALPVITRLEIDEYELFPGVDGTGLVHDFRPGVTVIAGVNGLGKTTLLNLMLRMLVGPFNPEKATAFEVGSKSHDMKPWFDVKEFFVPRVSDGAASATATAYVTIGTHKLKVTRRLTDLSIVYLEYDSIEIEPAEAFYQVAVLEASNASSQYDFDFLVRYLVFFLEQRVPLFWNERGQIETFRILLCDADSAKELSVLEDEIKEQDSLFRNYRWHATKRSKRLAERSAALAGSSSLEANVAALIEESRGLEVKNGQLVAAIEKESELRSQHRTRLLLAKIELEESRRSYEVLQEGFLAGLFPNVKEPARHIFTTLLSKSGCIVCGNRSARGYERLSRLLSHDDCPACESPIDEQERQAPKDVPTPADLEPAAIRLTNLQRSVSGLEKAIGESTTTLKALGAEQSRVQQERFALDAKLTKQRAKLPPAPQEVASLKTQVEVDEITLKQMRSDLEVHYIQYEKLLESVTDRVTEVSQIVQEKFRFYAKAFLSETCYLAQATVTTKLGESRSFQYPRFNLFMTSAVSHDVETERRNSDDVSESQREFVDLAFRMALISAVTSQGSRAMLVIETPEASLDEYFVEQAGMLLRQFSRADKRDGNVLVVSSNLAAQNMISSLLGFSAPEAEWPDAVTVDKQLINLLEESRPNAALRQHRDRYEKALKKSTHDRWQPRAH